MPNRIFMNEKLHDLYDHHAVVYETCIMHIIKSIEMIGTLYGIEINKSTSVII